MSSGTESIAATAERIACVIPGYNEELSIAEVVKSCCQQGLPVYVVDDGSSDATAQCAGDAGAEVIVHAQNMGKGQSLEDGMSRATADGFTSVIFLDADGQHPPQSLPAFVEASKAGADLVLGCRSFGEKMPFVRRTTNKFMGWVLSKLAGQKLGDTQCGYRLVRCDLWPKIKPSSGGFAAESEMLVHAARAGAKIVNVEIPTIYVEGRQSHIRPIPDTWKFILLVLRLMRSSSRPDSGKGE
jgi:glycosyltransferase involved in cell wall biosynthesis